MQALWLENQTLSFSPDQPLPKVGPGEALIKMRLAGICSTDLEMVRGYYPFTGVPGHEFVGEVVEVDGDAEARHAWIGRRVVGEINITCGKCAACRRGHPTHCAARRVLGLIGHNGVFAQYLTLPLANLHLVPETVPDEAAVFTEPLAAALEIQEQAHILPSSRILVVGAGRLGQLVAQTLALTGCELEVVARHPSQQAVLKARRIRVVTEAEVALGKFDLVVDASGSPGGFDLARRAVRPRGTIVLKSTYQGEMALNLSRIAVDEVTIIGSRCGPFEAALRLLRSRLVDVSPLIADQKPLSQGLEAFHEAGKPGVLKILITPG